MIEAKS